VTAALLSLRAATAGYAGRTVLHDVDLTIRAGERIALLGRSGAGKSTLLGLVHEHLRAQAALIPQAAALVRTLSVFHTVYMGRLDRRSTLHNLRTLAWPSRNDVEAVTEILRLVDLTEAPFAKAGALSGGQQQRVSVARALYNGRPVLIGDEPVSALDRAQGGAVLDRIRERHDTIILAMHDVELALGRSDRIIVLQKGRVVLDAPSRALDSTALAPFYETQR
jgi:phosphonate transport system ATP-binding protein